MRPETDRDAGAQTRRHLVYPKSVDVLRAAGLQPLDYYIHKRRATVAETVSARPILQECRGARRRRGTPVRPTWWEQDLTPPPAPERERENAPRRGTFGPPRGRTFPPGHPHHQPVRTVEETRAARRAERETWDSEAEAELDRRWAQAHMPADLPVPEETTLHGAFAAIGQSIADVVAGDPGRGPD